jgi:hypothetical protein
MKPVDQIILFMIIMSIICIIGWVIPFGLYCLNYPRPL